MATQLVPVVPRILDPTIPVILIRWMSKWFGDLNYYSRVSSDIILWSRWSQKICDLIAVFFLQMIEYVQFFWPFSSGCLPRFRDFQSEKHLKNDKIIQKPSKVTPLYKEGLYSLYSLHVGLWQHFSHLSSCWFQLISADFWWYQLINARSFPLPCLSVSEINKTNSPK